MRSYFEHEQRAGEHQKVAHAAEDGGRDKGSPARAEGGCKLRTGRLLLRRSEARIHKRLRTIVADAKLRSGS